MAKRFENEESWPRISFF